MAADCNCSNPSCPCYKGNRDKVDEQQAPGPDTPSSSTTETRERWAQENAAINAETRAIVDQRDRQFRQEWEEADRQVRQTEHSSNTNGGNMASDNFSAAADESWYKPFNNTGTPSGGSTMTAPSGGNNGGGDIMSVQDMRNHWQQAGTTAAGATDPLNSAASQLKELAARMEAVQAHAAQHGDETASQAAAAAETYRALAQKCDEAAAAVEPAVAGCAAAEQGLERFRPAEEALSSLPNRHEQTAAYVGS